MSQWIRGMDAAAAAVAAAACANDGEGEDELPSVSGFRVHHPPFTAAAATAAVPKPALRFVRDGSLPDGTVVCGSVPGSAVEQSRKVWVVRNDGSADWPEGVRLTFAGGDVLHVREPKSSIEFTAVAASAPAPAVGEIVGEAVPQLPRHGEGQIAVVLSIPQAAGRYVSYFRMQTREGQNFGQRLWADIVVRNSDSPAGAVQLEQSGEKAVKEEGIEERDERKRREAADAAAISAALSQGLGMGVSGGLQGEDAQGEDLWVQSLLLEEAANSSASSASPLSLSMSPSPAAAASVPSSLAASASSDDDGLIAAAADSAATEATATATAAEWQLVAQETDSVGGPQPGSDLAAAEPSFANACADLDYGFDSASEGEGDGVGDNGEQQQTSEQEEGVVVDQAAVPGDDNASLAASTVSTSDASASVDALKELWAKELGLLADMGFADVSSLLPLLQEHVQTPASRTDNGALDSAGFHALLARLLI